MADSQRIHTFQRESIALLQFTWRPLLSFRLSRSWRREKRETFCIVIGMILVAKDFQNRSFIRWFVFSFFFSFAKYDSHELLQLLSTNESRLFLTFYARIAILRKMVVYSWRKISLVDLRPFFHYVNIQNSPCNLKLNHCALRTSHWTRFLWIQRLSRHTNI